MYILEKISLSWQTDLGRTVLSLMVTPPFYSTHYSKCPPPAAMHFTALAFISTINLCTISGSIWATSLAMLACSSFRLAGRGQYTLDLRKHQRQKQSCKISRNLQRSDSLTNFYIKGKFLHGVKVGGRIWSVQILWHFTTLYRNPTWTCAKVIMDFSLLMYFSLLEDTFATADFPLNQLFFEAPCTWPTYLTYLPDLPTWPT